jgi:anthranilate phosphoribosyltransferase
MMSDPDASFDELVARLSNGEHLTRQQSRAALLHLTSGAASEEEIAALLSKMSYAAVTVEELTGAASVMREKVIAVPTGDGEVLDTCGTGGDVRHTYNISTAAALIAAACGVKVVKHGNRSASGKAGSADVLERLGVRLELPPHRLTQCLESVNICFAFAPALHPAMKCVSKARKQVGRPTIFNLLGPLTNPGRARLHLLGVFAPELTELLAGVLREMGSRRAWVVHAEDGLDEISTLGPTRVSELRDGDVKTWTLDPTAWGFAKPGLADLQVADVEEAAAALLGVLEGKKGPKRDIAVLNAAAALVIAGRAVELPVALSIAHEAVESGAARGILEELIRLSRA